MAGTPGDVILRHRGSQATGGWPVAADTFRPGCRRSPAHGEATARPAWRPGCQPCHGQAAEALRESFGQAEVQLADRLRIRSCDLRERAAARYELGRPPAPGPAGSRGGSVPLPAGQPGHQRPPVRRPAGDLPAGPPEADLLSAHGSRRQAGEPGTRRACPLSSALGVQPGAAGPVTAYGLLGHQSRVLEHRQVLAHSVVVQPDESGELGHDHRCRRVGELAEEAVARRVTQDHGLAPQVRGHGSPFRRENV